MTEATPNDRRRFPRSGASALPGALGLLLVALVGTTIRAADAPSSGTRPGIPDFAPPLEVRQFHAPGFARKAAGVIYDAASVKQGVPLGGLGTGYVDVNADGTLGVCSIFNRFVPPRKLNRPFLGIVVDGRPHLVSLRSADKVTGATAGRYWGHFPVADARYTFDLPVRVEVRAWSPFVAEHYHALLRRTFAADDPLMVRILGRDARRAGRSAAR